MSSPEQTARGVDALIARLRTDGVEAGTEEAARIVADAKAEAARIIADARAEANTLKTDASAAAERYENAGKEALNIAMRDAVLDMKSTLMAQFEIDVQRMVSQTLADPDILRQMVLELVGRAICRAGSRPGFARTISCWICPTPRLRRC